LPKKEYMTVFDSPRGMQENEIPSNSVFYMTVLQ